MFWFPGKTTPKEPPVAAPDTGSSVTMPKMRLYNKSHSRHFKRVVTLGAGGFGSVDLCTVREDKTYAKKGSVVAVKKIKSVSDRKTAEKEARILRNLAHKFIVRYLDTFKDHKGRLCIVMDYCDQGSLQEWLFLYPVRPFPEHELWRLVAQFSAALSYLHSENPPILHNDLKPANILCMTNSKTGDTIIKIADFGVCNVLGKILIF